MTHYLSNIDKTEADRVRRAAEISGQKVEYSDEPMPGDTGFYGRIRPSLMETCGCVVGHEEVFDYSNFWAAWRSLAPAVASDQRGTE